MSSSVPKTVKTREVGRRQSSQEAAGPEETVADRAGAVLRQGHLALYIVMLFFLLTVSGCAIMNRYVFLPKKEFAAAHVMKNVLYQDVWFTARDGVRLNGRFIPGAPETPLVVFFHGNAGNISDNMEYLNLLHSGGFPVFIFDYRGYGKSEGEPLRENDLYQDARGALSYLEGQGWQHKRSIYFGQSLGSAVALQMTLENPPAGLVMEGAFTSMTEIVKYISPLAYYTVGWWGIDLIFDSFAKIDRVEVPLLFIHGDRDTVVPVDMTRRLFARAGTPKMLHIISGGGHCDVFMQDSSGYLAAWSTYLQSLSIKIAAKQHIKP